MKNKRILKISQTNRCNGCHACYSICPVKAIDMKADKEGFLRPYIDYKKCISCLKCEKSCPILNPLLLNRKNPKAFAAYHLNSKKREISSSGGIFLAIAEQILEENGVVFGVKLNTKFEIIHSFTENIEGVYNFIGSKYVQSCVGNTFIEVKQFLLKGRKVLFSGTPCQIAGLKKYLFKEYENLLCVDIICHGVPSPKLFVNYKNYLETENKSLITNFKFRTKNNGWKQKATIISFENNKKLIENKEHNIFSRLYLKDVSLRNSCYQCDFKTIGRISDITLADFWGVEKNLPELNDDKGVSLILIHSKKGENIFNNCKIFKKEVDIQRSLISNPSAFSSSRKPLRRYFFYVDLEKDEFKSVISKYSNDNFIIKTYNKIVKKIFKTLKIKFIPLY